MYILYTQRNLYLNKPCVRLKMCVTVTSRVYALQFDRFYFTYRICRTVCSIDIVCITHKTHAFISTMACSRTNECVKKRQHLRKMRKTYVLLYTVSNFGATRQLYCCCHFFFLSFFFFFLMCTLIRLFVDTNLILYNIIITWQEIIYLVVWNWPTLGKQ